MSMPRVHIVVGTRPEAVKMAPLALALRAAEKVQPVVVATGQHTDMVTDSLAPFGLVPDETCTVVRTTGEQAELVAQLVPQLDGLLAAGSAAVVVQGDTTSALVGGLVGMWRRVPVVHLEAGLRSGDLAAPFPEEANRRLLGVFADLHLAPTTLAAATLRREGVAEDRIVLVGNTVVDAVLAIAAAVTAADAPPPPDPRLAEVVRAVDAGTARLMLVTAHRRENWGAPLARILDAVGQIVDEHPDLLCVVPAHANPAVRTQVEAAVGARPRLVVTGPLPYPELCRLLVRSTLVLSDSGGIQEEAPSFEVPVLVLREVTERVEAVAAGWAQLVGTDTAHVVAEAKGVLDGRRPHPGTGNPFGDGHAARRSAAAIAWMLGVGDRPDAFTGGGPTAASVPADGRRGPSDAT